MEKINLEEYADLLLRVAIQKTKNIVDAEDLVQETLLAGFHAIKERKVISNPKDWLVTVINHKYYDMLRLKYRHPVLIMDSFPDLSDEETNAERLKGTKQADSIRRSLAGLTNLYREVMIRYYFRNESIKKIAAALDVPENTVKSRLDIGRKYLRKDLNMENYTKQSYEPDNLWLSISGQCGMSEEPFSLVQSDKIKMNLLILAYEQPLTIPELAKAIGISTTYIEPIVGHLVNGELMKRVSNKVYTDFIIYSEKDRTSNLEIERSLADRLYRDIWVTIEQGLEELRIHSFYKNKKETQQVKLESYFAIKTMQDAVVHVRNAIIGCSQPFDSYPNRPNGGKWVAMGSHYSSDYDWKNANYQSYFISGESCVSQRDYCGQKVISLSEYDSELGRTHRGYNNTKFVKHSMSPMDVLKVLYAIHSDREEDLPIINTNSFENIEGFEKLNFLRKDEQGKILVDIPVISIDDRKKIFEVSEKYQKFIVDKFYNDLAPLLKNPILLPKHLKTVPEWQRYMHCSSTFSMMVILRAKHDGLFLQKHNHDNNPVPAIILTISE